jgi:hypothetical protein
MNPYIELLWFQTAIYEHEIQQQYILDAYIE